MQGKIQLHTAVFIPDLKRQIHEAGNTLSHLFGRAAGPITHADLNKQRG